MAIVLGAVMLLQSTAALATSLDIRHVLLEYNKWDGDERPDELKLNFFAPVESATTPDGWTGHITISYFDEEAEEFKEIKVIGWDRGDFEKVNEEGKEGWWAFEFPPGKDATLVILLKQAPDGRWFFWVKNKTNLSVKPNKPGAEILIEVEISPSEREERKKFDGSTLTGKRKCGKTCEAWDSKASHK